MQAIFLNGLLIGCIFTATVCGSEDAMLQRRTLPNLDDIQAAEDHEHHRIIIVVPKEMPHHVNHVHTYKLSGKGIPLIHTGKVVHDHKHNGKVAHEHGHVGKSAHSHKHHGAYGHHHKHAGHAAHKHFGKVHLVAGGKGGGGKGSFHHHHGRLLQHLRAPIDHRPLLRTAAHQLQHLHQPHQLHQPQQQHPGGGTSGVLGPPPGAGGRGGPVSGHVQFVPSSKPRGLGSFIPAEIQQYVQHNNGRQQLHRGPPPPPLQQQYVQHVQHHDGGRRPAYRPQQQQQQQHQQYVQQQQQQQYVQAPLAEDDGDPEDGPPPPPGYNVIHLRVPDQGGPEVIKSVDIDLTNNVAHLQAGEKVQQQQQPGVTENYKSVTQYNKVIGHGRAPSAEEEFDAQSVDDEDGEGGELLLEDVGYRFGEGYRLALDSGGSSGGGGGGGKDGGGKDGKDGEKDEEDLDEFNQDTSVALDFDDPPDGHAYSQTFTVQYP